MMHVDLVDMDDLVEALSEVGVECASSEEESVKTVIDNWLKSVDAENSYRFWNILSRIEAEGILLPEVENVINWSHSQFTH